MTTVSTERRTAHVVFIETLIIYAALFALQQLLAPKPKIENARPAGLGDFGFPTATEGRFLPIIWGKVQLKGPNLGWTGDLFQEPITQKIKQSMFSSTRRTIGFRYHLGMQLELCRGPIDAVHRMWVGKKEVASGTFTTSFDVDEPDLFGGEDLGAGGFESTIDIFPGTLTQAPSDYLSIFQDTGAGTNRTPRYTGSAYLVLRSLGGPASSARGAYIGNSTSIKPLKFEVSRYPGLFNGQTGTMNKIGVDCNPTNVIYELLTNVEWGFGLPATSIDVGASSSFKSASDTLISEGNGFSMVLDREMEAGEFLHEIERQIDGYVRRDPLTRKWKIKLARADYSIGAVPQFTDANVIDVRDYGRSSWPDTSNIVTLKFTDRDDDYKETFAKAYDSANAMIRGGGSVSTVQAVPTSKNYPGVFTASLANDLAWRDLRLLSYPLARATFIVDRTAWNMSIGDVFAWTSTQFGFTQTPMRITRVDLGRLQSNEIAITAVEDIFKYLAGSFAPPPNSGWTPPDVDLVAFPAAEQLAIEAPRALTNLDPDFSGDNTVAKVFCAARRQGSESAVQMKQRNAVGAPVGAYSDAGTFTGFMLIGKLLSSLPMAAANPTATVTVVPDPDSQTDIESQFDDATTVADMGSNLAQLIMVGNEFMLVQSASVSGLNVDLSTVYRGALDSAQESHAANAPVYLVFVGAGMTDTAFTNTNNVDIELRSRSASDTFSGVVTAISIALAKRALRPYPAAALLFNGSGSTFTTPSLEGAGAGLNGFRVDTAWWRRHFEPSNEVLALLSDDAGVDASTEFQLEVRADPAGANTLVGAASAWTTGTGPLQTLRADIVTAAAAGTLLRFILRTRHDIEAEVDLQSRYNCQFDVTPTSTLTGQFYLGGGLAANVASASYTTVATGTFTVNIGAVQTTANIQVSINGGAFATLTGYVAGVSTSGTFAATSGDTVRLRRTVNEAPNPNFVEIKNPSAVSVAYGTFKN